MSTPHRMQRAARIRAALLGARLQGLLRKAVRVFTADPGEAVDREVARTSAEALRRSAGALKGGAAKVAQLMAYLEDPEETPRAEAQALLATLFDQAPGEGAAGVRRVVEEDLGQPPERLFRTWEEAPFAAASLGQVHGATGPGGEDLAVKIQYPGVAEALGADLGTGAVLRGLTGAALGGALAEDVLAALRQAVLGECDYRAEARALGRFRRAYRQDRDVVIPDVFPHLSSGRVLTAERLRGRSLLGFAQDPKTAPEARSAAAVVIFRVAFGAPLVHGLLNADPNPGNFLLLPEGRVGFLDFGCTVELDERVVTCERVLWQALLAEDPEVLRCALHREGLVRKPSVFDSEHYRAWERGLRLPFATHRFRPDPAYARELALHLGALLRGRRFRLTPGLVLLHRQRLGLWAVLGRLGAAADFRRALLEILGAVDMAPAGVR